VSGGRPCNIFEKEILPISWIKGVKAALAGDGVPLTIARAGLMTPTVYVLAAVESSWRE